MNMVDQIYMGLIYLWSEVDKLIVSSAATSMVVAVLRMKKRGHIAWAEALLCGVFSALILYGFGFISTVTGITAPNGLSTGAAQLIAGAIGWYGTERTAKFLEDKIGADNDTNK